MAFFSYALSPAESLLAPAKSKTSFFARFLAALMELRQRQADREIAFYLQRTGGRLTDTVEREIERRFLPGSGGRP